MIKKYIKILFVVLIFTVTLIFANSDCFAKGQASKDVNTDEFVNILIQNGVGKNVVKQAEEAGLFKDVKNDGSDSGSMFYNGKKFQLVFQSGGYYLNIARKACGMEYGTFKSMYDKAPKYYQKVFDILVGIAKEMRNQEVVKFLFSEFMNGKGNEYADFCETTIETIAIKIFEYRLNEFKKAYEKACKNHYESKKITFDFEGEKYTCSDVYYSEEINDTVLGTDILWRIAYYIVGTTEGNLDQRALKGVSDSYYKDIENNTGVKTNKKIKDDSGTSSGTGNSGSGVTIDENGVLQLSFNEAFPTYIPNLKNAIEFASNAKDTQGIDVLGDSISSEEGSILDTVEKISETFKQFGIYFIFAAIIIIGARLIWAGPQGKSQMKMALPYVAIAIILFYMAPSIILLFRVLFGEISDLEGSTKDIFASIVKLVQIFAFAGLIFYGIKLLFANATGKAESKKGFIAVLIGTILVFSSTTVVSLILDTTDGTGVSLSANEAASSSNEETPYVAGGVRNKTIYVNYVTQYSEMYYYTPIKVDNQVNAYKEVDENPDAETGSDNNSNAIVADKTLALGKIGENSSTDNNYEKYVVNVNRGDNSEFIRIAESDAFKAIGDDYYLKEIRVSESKSVFSKYNDLSKATQKSKGSKAVDGKDNQDYYDLKIDKTNTKPIIVTFVYYVKHDQKFFTNYLLKKKDGSYEVLKGITNKKSVTNKCSYTANREFSIDDPDLANLGILKTDITDEYEGYIFNLNRVEYMDNMYDNNSDIVKFFKSKYGFVPHPNRYGIIHAFIFGFYRASDEEISKFTGKNYKYIGYINVTRQQHKNITYEEMKTLCLDQLKNRKHFSQRNWYSQPTIFKGGYSNKNNADGTLVSFIFEEQ